MNLELVIPFAGLIMVMGVTIWAFVAKYPKCVLCKKRGAKILGTMLEWAAGVEEQESQNSVKWVKHYGMYSEKTVEYYYHPSCVQEVLCKPEEHGHKKVDLALGIVERAAQQAEKEKAERKAELEAKLRYALKIKSTCKKVQRGEIPL